MACRLILIHVILVMQGKGYVSGVDWLDGGLVLVIDGVLHLCAWGERAMFQRYE